MSGTFSDRLAAAIQPGDVVTIERIVGPGTLDISVASKVDGYEKPLRGHAEVLIDNATPDALAKAIEAASGKITEYLAMRAEVQPD